MKKMFSDSFQELRNLRSMVMAAMLLAIAVVLGFFTLQLTEFIKIGFAYIANEFAGMMFGPVVGSLIGALADILKYMVNPTGPFFPGFTISGFLGGLIYGIVLYKKPFSVKRVIVANTLVTVLVNLLLNTYWLTLLYGNAYMALLPARIVKQLVMLPIEVILFYAVARILVKSGLFAFIRNSKEK